ncbi:MAG TPA: hypothetical protein EYG03_11885, partial [Planctomycetes bacterium]|nr:hypothetical protein [Planctomycetota bacterium]
MAIEFKLPAVAEGIESVDIAEILVAEGDTIEAGAIICEVETDKSVAEVDCPHGGTIAKILVKTGQSVPVGTPLVLIDTATGSAKTPETVSESPATDSDGSDVTAPPKSEPAPAAATPNGEKYEVEFSLPEVAEGVASVDIAEVLVSVGDVIKAGAVICEAETDKSVAEIDCPDAGTIKAVHVAVGQTVNVGEPLVTIEITSSPESSTPPAAPPTTTEAAAAPSKAVSSALVVETADSSDRRPPAPAGPATRRMARKLGVDLYQVQGSAKGGRIVIEDIEGFVRNR